MVRCVETAHDPPRYFGIKKRAVSRRQLLKTLIATGGAIAASTLLPGEWTAPLIEVGVLPVHAQGSVTPCAIPPSPLPNSDPGTPEPPQ